MHRMPAASSALQQPQPQVRSGTTTPCAAVWRAPALADSKAGGARVAHRTIPGAKA
jgi:hypothetical protein